MPFIRCLLLTVLFTTPALADEAVWEALAGGGHVVLMRHALAPGTGDPANFRIDDCSTQRNLDDTGRQQARATGAAFRERDIPVAAVYTSQWCRCRETAELLELAPVEDLPALNSFFQARERRGPQTEAARAFIAGLPLDGGNVVMVTHFVNIGALVGESVSSGELVVAERGADGALSVVGTIQPF
jgi:broad specificity phosphatase PhoE